MKKSTLHLALLATLTSGSAQAAVVLRTSDQSLVPGQPDAATVYASGEVNAGQFATSLDAGYSESRAVVSFPVPAGVAAQVTSATLVLPPGCTHESWSYWGQSDGYVGLNVADVTTDPTAAILGSPAYGLFEDLADGELFGSAAIVSGTWMPVRIPLNAAGLVTLQTAEGRFALGLSIAQHETYAYAFECQWGVDAELRLCTAEDEMDGDAVTCDLDNCPNVANDAQADIDGDGVGDACDVCPDTYDPSQGDRDADGIGDACDDGDLDGVMDEHDNCPTRPNVDQLDGDADGEGDACDLTPTHDLAAQRMTVSRTIISLAAGSGVATVTYDVKNLRNYPETFTATALLEGLPANCGVTAPAASITGVLPARGKQTVAFPIGITCGLNAPRGLNTVTGVSILELDPVHGFEMEQSNNYIRANGVLRLNR
jgi:hypothetical protein